MGRIFFFLLMTAGPLFAAGPITHAYLTDRFFAHFPRYTAEEKKAFMVGTLFPDIQYLGAAVREETHWSGVALVDVLTERSPFLAGVKFHSYVDELRERFVCDKKIYHMLSESKEGDKKKLYLKLKLLEDEMIYSMQDWQGYRTALQDILQEERQWEIENRILRKWHTILQACFSNPPSTIFFLLNMTKTNYLHISAEEALQWSKMLKTEVHSRQIRQFVLALLQQFERDFSQVKKQGGAIKSVG